MSNTKTRVNRRLKLMVSKSLADLLYQELSFLNIDCRIIQIEEQEIGTRSDFLRATINGYIQRGLNQGILEPVDLGEETIAVDFYLDKQSEGLWATAMRNGIAYSNNQLADCALYDYFYRQETIAQSLQQQLGVYREMCQRINLKEWR